MHRSFLFDQSVGIFLQLDEAEHTATSARVALEEQLSKMEHCLESSLHESKELKQQVGLLHLV